MAVEGSETAVRLLIDVDVVWCIFSGFSVFLMHFVLLKKIASHSKSEDRYFNLRGLWVGVNSVLEIENVFKG